MFAKPLGLSAILGIAFLQGCSPSEDQGENRAEGPVEISAEERTAGSAIGMAEEPITKSLETPQNVYRRVLAVNNVAKYLPLLGEAESVPYYGLISPNGGYDVYRMRADSEDAELVISSLKPQNHWRLLTVSDKYLFGYIEQFQGGLDRIRVAERATGVEVKTWPLEGRLLHAELQGGKLRVLYTPESTALLSQASLDLEDLNISDRRVGEFISGKKKFIGEAENSYWFFGRGVTARGKWRYGLWQVSKDLVETGFVDMAGMEAPVSGCNYALPIYSAAIQSGMFVETHNCGARGIDLATGKLQFQIPPYNLEIAPILAYRNGFIFALHANNDRSGSPVRIYDAATGEWTANMPGRGNQIYFAGDYFVTVAGWGKRRQVSVYEIDWQVLKDTGRRRTQFSGAVEAGRAAIERGGTIYDAIAEVEAIVSSPVFAQIGRMSNEDREAVAYYAGWLVQTFGKVEDGIRLLQALKRGPNNRQIDRVIELARKRAAMLAAPDPEAFQPFLSQPNPQLHRLDLAVDTELEKRFTGFRTWARIYGDDQSLYVAAFDDAEAGNLYVYDRETLEASPPVPFATFPSDPDAERAVNSLAITDDELYISIESKYPKPGEPCARNRPSGALLWQWDWHR